MNFLKQRIFADQRVENKPEVISLIKKLLYFFAFLSLFFSVVFWLNFIWNVGDATFLSSTSSKLIFIIVLFFSLSLCLILSFLMLAYRMQPWLLPYIMMALSGMMILCISFAIALFGNNCFNL